MNEYEIALKIAENAHKGQKDKIGADYILHPLAVAELCIDSDFYAAQYRVKYEERYPEIRKNDLRTIELGEKSRVVALLHDVVEDTDITLEMLRAEGISEDVIMAVDVLTKRENQPLIEYHKRIAANDLAIIVKFADLAHNTCESRATQGDNHWLENPSKPPKMPKEQFLKHYFKYGERAYELRQLVGEKFSWRSYSLKDGNREVEGLLSSSVIRSIEKLIRKYLIYAGIAPKITIDDYFVTSDDLRSFRYKVERLDKYDPKRKELFRSTPRIFFERIVCFDDGLRERFIHAPLSQADIQNVGGCRSLAEFDVEKVITSQEGITIFEKAKSDWDKYKHNISVLTKWARKEDIPRGEDWWAHAVYQSFYFFFWESGYIEKVMRLNDEQLEQPLSEQQAYELLELTRQQIDGLKQEYSRDW